MHAQPHIKSTRCWVMSNIYCSNRMPKLRSHTHYLCRTLQQNMRHGSDCLPREQTLPRLNEWTTSAFEKFAIYQYQLSSVGVVASDANATFSGKRNERQ